MREIIKIKSRPLRIAIYLLSPLLIWWIIMFIITPRPLFQSPYATLLYARNGEFLDARIAADEQWRFPPSDSTPYKFAQCLITYEDKRFYHHPGIDPLAIARAVRSNIKSQNVVSGGSTLTMQLARTALGNGSRNIFQKLKEASLALYLETTSSKNKILTLYASHAPFGGNVVGLEAASWRYYGRSPESLSWAESATLAVLPNAPSLIHVSRNRDALLSKRNRLLKRLLNNKIIDSQTYSVSIMEPLPEQPTPLPAGAKHLLSTLALKTKEQRLTSSVDAALQHTVQDIVDRYAKEYEANYIYNAAAVVADIESGEVLAYVGNVSFNRGENRGESVDIITSRRSTGSLLKPMLYAGMINDGLILPNTLIADTPLNINGFVPQNYTKTFYGAVPASNAIARSLNVPLVRMLSKYRTGRLLSLLKQWGMTTLNRSEDNYGASLILGGAEGTLWDMVGMYASVARTLNHYYPYSGRYNHSDIHPLSLSKTEVEKITSAADKRLKEAPSSLSAASLWFAVEAMSGVNRPEEESQWQQFSSMKRVAWKTGTSYGGRDAWSIGITPQYAIGVWVGNASGEGREALTGVGSAAPIMFDILSILSSNGTWFEKPFGETQKMAICRKSGHKASEICDIVDTLDMPSSGNATSLCPYHKRVQLSSDGKYQVNSSCESLDNIVATSWFVLPPAQEYYYKSYNLDYKVLPPTKEGYINSAPTSIIEIIYPEHNSKLFLPKGFSGKKESFIFEAACSDPSASLYWHLNNEYIATTTPPHRLPIQPPKGTHLLTVSTPSGDVKKILFSVL